jgi:hypothetical protein
LLERKSAFEAEILGIAPNSVRDNRNSQKGSLPLLGELDPLADQVPTIEVVDEVFILPECS